MRRLAAFACFAFAAPAAAQFAQPHNYGPVDVPNPFVGDSRQRGPGLGRELHDIRERLHRERESGALSRSEARRLKREANAIAELAGRYADEGMPSSARAELEARAHYLSDAVNRPR